MIIKAFVPRGQVFIPETPVISKVFVPEGKVFVPESLVYNKAHASKGQPLRLETPATSGDPEQIDKVTLPATSKVNNRTNKGKLIRLASETPKKLQKWNHETQKFVQGKDK